MLKAKVDAPEDLNPRETSEWLEALDQMVDQAGPGRASYLLKTLLERAAAFGVTAPLKLRQTRWHQPPKTAQVPGSLFPRTALVLCDSGEAEQVHGRSVRVDLNLVESFLAWPD
jgi:hypothetical protein